jgi:cobalt-zinc-cadmium efflux system outer membrane protein
MFLTVALLGALSAPTNDVELSHLVWERSVELQSARARIAQAQADAARARLLPNPSLDVSYNTIPVGPHNPAGEPFLSIPNLQVGASELIELGKRGPRQESTSQFARAVGFDTIELLRQRFFDVKELYADIATSQARIASFSQLVEGAARLTELEEARAHNGEVSSLDLDRAHLEEEKLRSSLAEEKERLRAGLRSCTLALGDVCDPFTDAAAATHFLEALAISAEGASFEVRPDLLSLQAQGDAARAARTLAERHAIPDLTLRFGYVKDWFVTSGNQPNSLFVGVSLPLPLFDHGQHDAQAAGVLAAASDRARTLLLESSSKSLTGIGAELTAFEERRARLRGTTIPLAKKIVDHLGEAVARGAAALQDLILARRNLEELSIDALDLELAAFKLSITRARLSGVVPPLPPELSLGSPS